MTREAVEEVLQRVRDDPSFRAELDTRPDAALHGYDITYAERAAIISGDTDRLRQLGVSEELSRVAAGYDREREEPLR